MESSVGGHYQCARVLCREFSCDCNIAAFLGGVTGECTASGLILKTNNSHGVLTPSAPFSRDEELSPDISSVNSKWCQCQYPRQARLHSFALCTI